MGPFLRHPPRRLLSAAALAATGALIAGCGGTSHTQTVSLAHAADLSARAVGFKMAMTMHETLAGRNIEMNGNGAFDARSHDGSATMHVSAGGQTFPLRVIVAGNTIYEKLPAQLARQLPPGRPWLRINLNALGRSAHISGFGSLLNSDSPASDPTQYLDYLKAVSGSVRRVGQQTLGGVQTTHYRAHLDISKLPHVVPAAQRRAAEQLVVAVKHRFHGSYSPVDVWIDQSNLVRKLKIGVSFSLGGHSAEMTLTERITAYGPQRPPAAPSTGQTTSLASLMHHG